MLPVLKLTQILLLTPIVRNIPVITIPARFQIITPNPTRDSASLCLPRYLQGDTIQLPKPERAKPILIPTTERRSQPSPSSSQQCRGLTVTLREPISSHQIRQIPTPGDHYTNCTRYRTGGHCHKLGSRHYMGQHANWETR